MSGSAKLHQTAIKIIYTHDDAIKRRKPSGSQKFIIGGFGLSFMSIDHIFDRSGAKIRCVEGFAKGGPLCDKRPPKPCDDDVTRTLCLQRPNPAVRFPVKMMLV